MRIIHVLTLVTPDGEYGGPLRVALNQVAGLRAAGHDVILAAGASGFGPTLPTRYAGVDVTLFPAHKAVPGTGFAGLVSPGLTHFLLRWGPTADIGHVHLARDLVGLPAALTLQARGVPYVAQTHGMVDASDSPLAAPLDAVMTRRALRGARRVLGLTERELDDLREVDPALTELEVLHNGVPETHLRARPAEGPPEVLFLARLAPRKRPVEFVQAAQVLARRYPDATFAVVGPDEGEADPVRRLLADDDADGRITYEGPLPPDQTVARMAQAAVYVLPAVDEPYGMTLIEAMSVGLPTVAIDDCGLAPLVRSTGGAVADPSVESLVAAIDELLTDPSRRLAAGEAGRQHVAAEITMQGIARRLDDIYSTALGDSP